MKSRLLIICLIIAALFYLGITTPRATVYDGLDYAEQYSAVSLTQMTTADDTSDVVQLKSIDWNRITFHLIVSSINDSCHVKFQGSCDNAESTYTNLDVTGNPTKITIDGCHTFSFTNSSNFYYYRWIWISESGGTDAIISSKVTIGKE